MKRDDLIWDLRRYARKRGLPFDLVKGQGKGSHYTVRLNGERTTVQSGELDPYHVRRACQQLKIDPALL